jgi:hypothetical protein
MAREHASQGRLGQRTPPEDWRGEPRSNDTHQSTTDPESRLYRKSNAAPAPPSYLGHVLTDNRHGLVVNVRASSSDGTRPWSVGGGLVQVASGAVSAKRLLFNTAGSACRSWVF